MERQKNSRKMRERVVRMMQEHHGEYASVWAAMSTIAPKIGCTAETLGNWVQQSERDVGYGEAVELVTLEWVDWFNNCRRSELIGNIRSAEAEAGDYAQTEALALAA
jgi:transposase-like protein